MSEYEKMASSFKELVSSEEEFKMLNKLEWVVTEKIHGANFRFIYDNKKLLFGKRKELLHWNADFFGFQTIASLLEQRVISMFEQLTQDLGEMRFTLYGELFGGSYPHPEVPAMPDVEAIQTGIFYSPRIEFFAYDIALEYEDLKKEYLNFVQAKFYFEKFEIPHVKPICKGQITDVLNFDILIDSKIPHQLNLPKIENNLIEGVVVKPLNYELQEGTKLRPIFKLKNPQFNENRNFHQAKKWSYVPQIQFLSENLDFLMVELRNYILRTDFSALYPKLAVSILKKENRQ